MTPRPGQVYQSPRAGSPPPARVIEGLSCLTTLATAILLSTTLAISGTGVPVAANPADPPADEPASGEDFAPRPRMRSLDATASGDTIPSQRAMVDARARFKRRFGTPGSRARTSAGALHAVDALLAAAISEPDAALKWMILDEARRLGVAAGSAVAVTRSIRLASAEFDFDAVALEYRSLLEIPLRALDPVRARDLARSAEGVATLAETDLRPDLAVLAQALAVRAWQRTGDNAATLKAAQRHDALESVRVGEASGR